MSNKVLSNQRVSVRAGLASAISNWKQPLLSELTALTDISSAINWNSFDLNIQNSNLKDDRTLTDGAGSQSRSPYINFGGHLQATMPKVTDLTSIYRTVYSLLSTPRVELVIAVRYGPLSSTAPAAADKWTFFHVITDPVIFGENEVSVFYEVHLIARDDIMVQYIVPVASPTAPVVTALASTATVAGGTLIFASATYQGWDVTKVATWSSSDETKLTLVHPGIFRPLAAGTPAITVSYPGSLAATPVTITLT